jgi:hypothetical protein
VSDDYGLENDYAASIDENGKRVTCTCGWSLTSIGPRGDPGRLHLADVWMYHAETDHPSPT